MITQTFGVGLTVALSTLNVGVWEKNEFINFSEEQTELRLFRWHRETSQYGSCKP